ncbi:MAG: DMT family transporter [Suipraeoptans sp.]
MNESNNNQKKYAGLILLQSLVYGFGNPLTKVAYESTTPFILLAIRFTLAFFIFMLFFGKRIITHIKEIKFREFFMPSICMALAYISCNVALSLTSATNVGFMMSLSVIIAPILSVPILKRKYNKRQLPIQLLVLIGVFLLHYNGEKININNGDIISLFMAMFLAASLVYGEKSVRKSDPIVVSSMQSGMTAILSIVCVLVFDDFTVVSNVEPSAWMVIIYLAIFCTCLAYFFQNKALVKLKSSTVAMLQCTQPILTAGASFLILGETMGVSAFIGGIIILSCILLQIRSK